MDMMPRADYALADIALLAAEAVHRRVTLVWLVCINISVWILEMRKL